MKTRWMLTLLAGGLCLALATPAPAADVPTVEEIFAKHTEAIGGNAIAKVENVALEFSFSMPEMGLNTTGEAYLEVPDKSYTRVSLVATGTGDFEDGVNGDVAWQVNSLTGPRLLEGIEKTLTRQRSHLSPYANWKDFWETAEAAGEQTVGENACYKVVLTHPEGGTVSVYFDKEDGLVRQQEIPVPQMGATVTVTPTDYREVEGITMPFRIDQKGPMSLTIEYTDVRVNVDDIPEDTFELPAAVKAMVAAK